MNLYKLTREQELILWTLEENGGELTPEIEARLDLTAADLPVQAEGRVRWLRSIAAEIEALVQPRISSEPPLPVGKDQMLHEALNHLDHFFQGAGEGCFFPTARVTFDAHTIG